MSNFRKLNIDELIKELNKYEFKQLHIHHTWKPNKSNFNGSNHFALQQGMKDYHINNRKWQDIGQHVTLFPDGIFVTGRAFNVAPASIKGWNTGAFAVEMLGDFDSGKEILDGEQKKSILKLIKYFVNKYGKDSIKFHREGKGVTKTCPGTSLDKSTMIKEAMEVDNKMKDKDTPSEWAKESWKWAKERGITDGTRPTDNITREEVATMLYRYYKTRK